MSDSGLQARLVAEYITITGRFGLNGDGAGWVEYKLWEVLEGRLKSPSPFFPPLTEEEMDILRLLRDEVKVWVFWQDKRWCHVDAATWKTHVDQKNAMGL